MAAGDSNVVTGPTNEIILRNTGISEAKAKYIRNVAKAFVDKEIEITKIRDMADEEVIEVLTQIKGIGRWSAEMILIFTLNRPDVFSIGDLGLRKAIENLYGIKEKEKEKTLALTESWNPNLSIACWYLWRSLENRPVSAILTKRTSRNQRSTEKTTGKSVCLFPGAIFSARSKLPRILCMIKFTRA